MHFWDRNSVTQLRLFCNFPFVADLRESALASSTLLREMASTALFFSEVNKEQVQIMRFLTATATFFDEQNLSIEKKCAQNLWNKPSLILLRKKLVSTFLGWNISGDRCEQWKCQISLAFFGF